MSHHVMCNRRIGPVAVKTESTAWGEMVAIRSRRLFLTVDEAEELARQLIVSADRVRERIVRPATRLLPLSEVLDLALSGDSDDRDAAPGNRCGDTISAGGAS